MDFVIDKRRSLPDDSFDVAESSDDEQGINFIPLDDLDEGATSSNDKKKTKPSDPFNLNNTYLITNYSVEGKSKTDKSYVDNLMNKSCIKSGLEKLNAVPTYKNKRVQIKERKKLREKTKGNDWYNLPATEVTEEIQNDLEILKMRSVLDSKHMYKKNNIKVLPKYFQMGTVIEGAADFYSARIPKSQRKKTLVDELLADSNFRAYQKKKYKEIVDDNRRKRPRRTEKRVSEKKKSYQKRREEWLSFD